MPGFPERKTFSHRRNNFPPPAVAVGAVVQQRMGEAETDQLVAFCVSYPDCPGTQVARRLGQVCPSNQGGTGDFQRNLRRERQRAPYRNQNSSGGNVQCRSKLQQFLATIIPAADKNRNSQG